MSFLENDSGEDGEVRHKRFDYPAPSIAGVIDFVSSQAWITDVQAGILLNQTPREIHQLKKLIRCYLRAPCPWNAPHDLVDDDGMILCRMDERPLGWMMPIGKKGELFRHLVQPPIAKLYPDLFVEPDLETQIRQDQPHCYGRFKYAPFIVCREVLTRMIEACAAEMRANFCLRDADTESQHISPQPKLKRFRLDDNEDESVEKSGIKRRMAEDFEFADIKVLATPPQVPLKAPKPCLSIATSTKLDRSPLKPIEPLDGGRNSPSTVSELLEQEEVFASNEQSNQATSPAATAGRYPKDTPIKSSVSSTTSDERIPVGILDHMKLASACAAAEVSPSPRSTESKGSERSSVRDDYGMIPTLERRRLKIGNIPNETRKRDLADFFRRYHVGNLWIVHKKYGSQYGFADFDTERQAKRAMEDLDRGILLGNKLSLGIAHMPGWREEKKKYSRHDT